MKTDLVNQIAQAILYEGYILYPYRRSAIKNQQRWNFGVLYPRSYAEAQTGHDAWSMQTEVLARAEPESTINISARFLHLVSREIGKFAKPLRDTTEMEAAPHEQVGELQLSTGELVQSWQEARERQVNASLSIDRLLDGPTTVSFWFPQSLTTSPIEDQKQIVGVVARQDRALSGEIVVVAEKQGDDLYKFRVSLNNSVDVEETDRNGALLQSLLSAHVVARIGNGEFISLLDPPDEHRAAAAACSNIGCWPVLVGADGERNTMLASPIILYDYPQVAPQSTGELFDGTEIDEILSLRILTLTDDEKREMQTSDERARRILERTEAMPVEQFMKLHGVMKTVTDES